MRLIPHSETETKRTKPVTGSALTEKPEVKNQKFKTSKHASLSLRLGIRLRAYTQRLSLYLRRVEALYETLLKEGIVQLREHPPFFRWASGRLSPIYLDFRRCLAYPTLRRALIERLLARLTGGTETFRGVVGVATGGISWAAWLAERLELPMGYVRSTPKSHGTNQTVEALAPSHSPILLIEDVLSTGQSVATALTHLQNQGFTISAIAVLWDYALPSGRSLLPYPLYDILRFPKALQAWQNHLSPSQYHTLKKWYETDELPS